jgi:hypothetical protein
MLRSIRYVLLSALLTKAKMGRSLPSRGPLSRRRPMCPVYRKSCRCHGPNTGESQSSISIVRSRRRGSNETDGRSANLDIINDDIFLFQKKSKFGLVLLLEFFLEATLSLTFLLKNHDGRVRTIKTHIEHPLKFDAIFCKALLNQLRFDVGGELVKSGLELW